MTSDDVVYRNVQGETVVVHLESGEIYHFSENTRDFLDRFKNPTSLDDNSPAKIREFCQLLLEKQILRESQNPVGRIPEGFDDDLSFLRKDDKTIDDIVFLCP